MHFLITFSWIYLVSVRESYTFASAFENETLLKRIGKSSLTDLRYNRRVVVQEAGGLLGGH